ncbi:MAG TPA: tryptophan-rich sensory protein [Candidatus Merdivicinus intestinigallinarum]|nr:tryptophan-rich sensory protein [Candidatus Merdivicinus intestinigallinarum]
MENRNFWEKAGVYAGFIIGTLLVGGLAGFLIRGSMETYASLNQPPLAPPGKAFPIVWGILYLLMGIGSARVFLTGKSGRRFALVVYWVQLFFNFCWSLIFFNARMYLAAFLWLIVLWVLIAMMVYAFWKLDRPAGLLQIPYLLWVAFAGYLNCAVWLLN